LNAKPFLKVDSFFLRGNGPTAVPLDINPPTMMCAFLITDVNQAKKLYKAKAFAFHRDRGVKVATNFILDRDTLRFNNVPWAQANAVFTWIGRLRSEDAVSSAVTITLDDATWTSTPINTSAHVESANNGETQPGCLKRRRTPITSTDINGRDDLDPEPTIGRSAHASSSTSI
ncbi:hypothetical protein OC842_006837, partial [Tilletia horrida]